MSVETNTDGSCEHLNAVSAESRATILKRYRKVMSWCVSEDMRMDALLNKHAGSHAFPSCTVCTRAVPRPSACLLCEGTTCRLAASSSTSTVSGKKRKVPKIKDCTKEHYTATGHGLAVDGATGAVYCHECNDWVYALAFEGALGRVRRLQEERLDISVGEDGHSKRVKYKSAKGPDLQELLNKGLTKSRCHAVRPLLNLSQTCFLSAILQSLLHNPLWKQYFLSSGHDRRVCALRRAKAVQSGEVKPHGDESQFDSNGAGANGMGCEENGPGGLGGVRLSELGLGVGECMNCEMDGAFAEAYGGEMAAYGPVTMLFSMWKANTELAGYAQQDAHAFFLTALNQVHAHYDESTRRETPDECPCIAHRTFSGSLLSTVTCTACGSSTATKDPILDVSLELKQRSQINPGESLTLADCLRTFTAKEPLSEREYACSECQDSNGHAEAVKQLSFKTLPATLAIQLKRFEHSNSNLLKVDTMVNFPTELDMRPYMTDALEGRPADLPAELYHYKLASVVTHEGKLDNGHYWTCVESGSGWFLLDDDKVSPISLAQVLAQKAYMLFYVKTSLAFGAEGEC